MQLLTLAALAATASASFVVRDADTTDPALFGISRVVNRCPYDVYLWSVDKQPGCPKSKSTLLKKNGGEWEEKMYQGTNGGISIKLSKWEDCGGKELSQLEYNIETKDPKYMGNYLDMSFVDCQGEGDCPGWHDGFYMESGKTGTGEAKIFEAKENNEHCPILKSSNAVQAAKISYVLPDDRQTKFCKNTADLVLYICGDQAPGASAPSSASSIAAPSSKAASSSSYKALPTTLQVTPSKPASSAEDVQVKAAAVTPAPEAPAPEAAKAVKTVVTYVTAYVDAPVRKRHAHGRRHNRA